MSISSIGSQTSLIVQSLVDMRAQLDDLQRQLGTGKKSDTYAGMGLERGMAVGLRARLSALGGYDEAITNVACDQSRAERARPPDGHHARGQRGCGAVERHQQQRIHDRAIDGLFRAQRDARAAQHAGR
jgi:hypothetical protein